MLKQVQHDIAEVTMKILHILNDGPTKLSGQMIKEQSKNNQVKVIDLSKKEASYDSIINEIFSNDRVISW